MKPSSWRAPAWLVPLLRPLAAALLALAGLCALLILLDISPLAAVQALAGGTVGNWRQFTRVLAVWCPLVLAASGLLFSFRAGLWNIGVEGQVMVGAVAAVGILRVWPEGWPRAGIAAALLAALAAGALLGVAVDLLRRHGGVNEIFGGLGCNFTAQAVIIWLILGPWRREMGASMSGTELLPTDYWLRPLPGTQVSPVVLAMALLALALTGLVLGATRLGLQLRAVGINARAAAVYGIRADRLRRLAMSLSGGLAALAGAVQVLAVYHRLIPAISSGYGYLALLAVMLTGFTAPALPLVCLFFAILSAGAIQFPLVLQVDSALSGVIQGFFVLAALLVHGLGQRR